MVGVFRHGFELEARGRAFQSVDDSENVRCIGRVLCHLLVQAIGRELGQEVQELLLVLRDVHQKRSECLLAVSAAVRFADGRVVRSNCHHLGQASVFVSEREVLESDVAAIARFHILRSKSDEILKGDGVLENQLEPLIEVRALVVNHTQNFRDVLSDG